MITNAAALLSVRSVAYCFSAVTVATKFALRRFVREGAGLQPETYTDQILLAAGSMS
ncbi:hypothetical protein SAMCFNEI73_pB0280 (plasmid) [Sinorhizobium americanum]|uniref:Uncharacterized protein n=1 Tax=Sinorhizobium americanum TaxID=194963 RepID=A0A1L3LTS5_9HYPH|nr:hypothetical protein SAMCFNEI73_pB0280 [Sinorhizobium americanum]